MVGFDQYFTIRSEAQGMSSCRANFKELYAAVEHEGRCKCDLGVVLMLQNYQANFPNITTRKVISTFYVQVCFSTFESPRG